MLDENKTIQKTKLIKSYTKIKIFSYLILFFFLGVGFSFAQGEVFCSDPESNEELLLQFPISFIMPDNSEIKCSNGDELITKIDEQAPDNQVYRVATWLKGWFVIDYNEEIKKIGVRGIFLGSYIKWDIFKQLELVKTLGFSENEDVKEGTYDKWENLDVFFTVFHDYFKFLKYLKSFLTLPIS